MRRAIVTAFCVLAACGRSPSAPTSPPPSNVPPQLAQYTGFWSGTFRLSTCEGHRHCFAFRGSARPFELRLQQSGASVRGVFNASQSITDVAGTVLSDGSLTLTGSDPGAAPGSGSVTARVELRFSPEGTLQGTLLYETRPLAQNADFSFPTTYGGEVIEATRSDISSFAADINGAWAGTFIVRSCTPQGRYCYPLLDREVEFIEMTLSAVGTAVNGTVRVGGDATWIPLTGVLNGSTVRLSGETIVPSGGGSTLRRVSDWTARLDEFGRMSGSFTYAFSYPLASPTLGESAAIDLWQVVKRQ